MTSTLTAIWAICICAPGDVQLDSPVPQLAVERDFRAALETRILNAGWERVPLRVILNDLARSKNVSIVLDRRVNSEQQPAVKLQGETFYEAIELVASKCGAGVSVIGNCIYVGPTDSARKLATLVELRRREIFGASSSRPGNGSQLQLSKKTTVHWNDLDESAAVIEATARTYGQSLTGIERIPHDLWRRTTLPAMDAVETLSVLLIQFDQTFRLSGTSIAILPAPAEASFEKLHTPRGQTAARAATEWQAKFGVKAEPRGRQIAVVGTVEDHEDIAELIRPTSTRPRPRTGRKLVKPPSIEFTFSQKQVPVLAIVNNLTESGGFTFKYDAAVLTAAGVDLTAKVDINVQKASPEEFLKAVFDPINVAVDIAGKTVTLRAK